MSVWLKVFAKLNLTESEELRPSCAVGYTVWLAVSDNDPATEKAEIEQMTNHPVDGIVLASVNSRSKHLKAYPKAQLRLSRSIDQLRLSRQLPLKSRTVPGHTSPSSTFGNMAIEEFIV